MRALLPIITERDLSVLNDLYKYRLLSVTQIQRLHFPSLQTTYRRLRALTQLGYIKGFVAPPLTEHMYYLEKPGADIVAAKLSVSITELNWHRINRAPTDSYFFLPHLIAINDFRIAITQASPAADLMLLGFIPDYVGERTSDGCVKKYIRDAVCDKDSPDQTISHTPDAVFALAKQQAVALFFLEIDRGTESLSNEHKGVLKSLKFYDQYLITGQYQRYKEEFNGAVFKGFRALYVMPSTTRIENVRQVITNKSFSEKTRKFMWLTTHEQITAATVLQPIWRSADANDQNIYRIG